MSELTAPQSSRRVRSFVDPDEPIRDRGGVLVLVLVTGVIATLFVLPILYYVTNVARANQVVSNKAEAVELSEGGIWIALSNQGDLFDLCVGGPLVSSLDDVTTTCEVIATETLRDPSEVPFDAAVVQADRSLPAGIGTNPYTNPNTAADPASWATTPDWSLSPAIAQVWMPQLPVRPTSGGDRIKDMTPGAQDSNYASCQVFFPGTFSDPIVIDEPTYFTSGVYYFEQPIIVRSGADVVAGRGSEIGCTNDFEAGPGVVGGPPIPLNTSGIGATFVLGDAARIEIDDDGSDSIRFVMNQRYVADDETGVAASASVSIVSVNGAHAPLLPAESAGDPLTVPGEIWVPASTIGVDASPLAVNEGYVPSILSPRPSAPDAPIITAASSYQRDRSGNGGPNDRGRVTVFWDEPSDNGSLITGYTVTDATTGRSCSPTTIPDRAIQTSCTIDGITNQSSSSGLRPVLTVTATNDAGTSAPSVSFEADRLDLRGRTQVSGADTPDAPDNATATLHTNGVFVSWDISDDGGSPITGYRVSVEGIGAGGTTTTCFADWNETGCVAPTPTLGVDAEYRVDVVALQTEGDPGSEFVGDVALVEHGDIAVAPDAAPDMTPAPLVVDARTPILDFSIEHGESVDIVISGYVSVPQGRIEIGSASPGSSSVAMLGGMLAGEVVIDPAGAPAMEVRFDNPIGQKRVRIVSVADSKFSATSTAIVQVNESGSIAINSWVVQ